MLILLRSAKRRQLCVLCLGVKLRHVISTMDQQNRREIVYFKKSTSQNEEKTSGKDISGKGF